MRLTVHWALIAGIVAVQPSLAAAAPPSFESYPATRGLKKRASSINWSSHPDARRFKTVLIGAFSRGAKFAGHYAVATWGCGSDCQMIAIIDVENGKVTFGPSAELDFEYRSDSRLLVANSPSAVQESIREFSGCPDKDNYWAVTSHYYEWTGTQFQLIADVSPDRTTPCIPLLSHPPPHP